VRKEEEKEEEKTLTNTSTCRITFYRGGWCPYCNLALRSFQKNLAAIQAAGVTLVAISPEVPDAALTTAEKHELAFPVLSDLGNAFARRLGLVWKQPDAMRPVFAGLGHDMVKFQGDDSLEVPVPATLLVDKEGIVREAFIVADWSVRVDPEVVLGWIGKL
jgi:peroxiredoxin